MRTLRLSLLLSFSLLLLPGCGGGGGGGTTDGGNPPPPPPPPPPVTPQMTQVSGTLQWAARSRSRSRVTTAPSSALSALITIRGAGVNGQDIALRINREASPAAYTQTYTLPEEVKVGGPYEVTALFFAEPGGAGAVVAQATVSNFFIVSGGSLPDFALEGTITQVEMGGGQSILVGEAKTLTFTPRGAQGEVIAVSPGSAFFAVISRADRLRVENGQLVGVAPGTAVATVTVDGRTSVDTAVQITSNAVVTVSPPEARLSINERRQFTAAVTETGNQTVTWHIAEGVAGGTIAPDGWYTAPATAGVYHLVATSVYDPAKTATVTITVEAGNVEVGVDFPESGDVNVIVD